MLITIARQCGSDAKSVGEMLSKRYQIPVYNKDILIERAKEKGVYDQMPNFFAEVPVSSLLYAIASGEGMTNLGAIPIQALRDTVGDKDCIVIGRCGNYAFADRPDVVRIFLSGEKEVRVAKMMSIRGISEKEAKELVKKTDEQRAAFQKYYTGQIWGDARYYDMCINTSRIGSEAVAGLISQYIDESEQAKTS